MVQRADRLADFITDADPAPETMVQVLCQDHVGTYTLPYPCLMSEGVWINAATRCPIEMAVVGWRTSPGTIVRPNRRWEPHRPTNRG